MRTTARPFRSVLALACLSLLAAAPGFAADEPVDLDAVNAIRNEGFEHSQVMDTARSLTVEIGSRLTGSPGMTRANEWTRDRLTEWGLENAHTEAWGPFGRGWSFDRAAIHLVDPVHEPLVGLPKAWTPGTDGPVRGEIMRVTIEDEDDLERYRGLLEGKVLLLDEPRELRDRSEPALEKYDEAELEELQKFEIPEDREEDWRTRFGKLWKLRQETNAFFAEEGAVATIEISSRDSGLVRLGSGGSRWPDESVGVPAVVLTAEHYNRLTRLLELAGGGVQPAPEEDEEEAAAGDDEGTAMDGMAGDDGAEADEPAEEGARQAAEDSDEADADEPPIPVPVVEIDVVARFHDEDDMAYNTVAEIPGTDLADQVVMLGGHLDSWHPATGAADNAAGVAVAMEAVRILREAGLRPRRTVRIALWSGEEQGLLGSRAYVHEHFGGKPLPDSEEERRKPSFLWPKDRGPLEIRPEHAGLSAYFNVDNGGGKIRGIYTQGNVAVAPIFEAWLAPLHDLGATTVSTNDTGGTDHLAFDAVGLPGFQFIQDERDYFSTTHHTNADTFDHLDRESLMEASVVLATFVYQAANRDEMLPRKPLPKDD